MQLRLAGVGCADGFGMQRWQFRLSRPMAALCREGFLPRPGAPTHRYLRGNHSAGCVAPLFSLVASMYEIFINVPCACVCSVDGDTKSLVFLWYEWHVQVREGTVLGPKP